MENPDIRETTFETHDYSELYYSGTSFLDSLIAERDAWQWVKETEDFIAGKEFFKKFIDAKLELAAKIFKEDGPINRKVKVQSYISSNGPTAKFINQIKEHHGKTVALFALIYSQPDYYMMSVGSKDSLNDLLNERSSAYERQLALFLIFTNNKSADFINIEHSKNLNRVIGEFSSAAQASLANVDMLANEKKSEINAVTLKNQQTQKRRVRRYRKIFDSLSIDSKEKLTSANIDLESAKTAYHETVDFQASVSYWKTIEEQCSRSKKVWLFLVAACIALIFLSLTIYYHVGGLSGNSNSEKIVIQQPNSLEVPKPLATPNNTPDLIHGVADLTGAALLVALLSVLLRISLRQFNTYSHLAQDATEKTTMTKTYLALLNEGKLNSEHDRKLVLEALFRPSQPSSVSETSSSTPIELVVKAITERRP